MAPVTCGEMRLAPMDGQFVEATALYLASTCAKPDRVIASHHALRKSSGTAASPPAVPEDRVPIRRPTLDRPWSR